LHKESSFFVTPLLGPVSLLEIQRWTMCERLDEDSRLKLMVCAFDNLSIPPVSLGIGPEVGYKCYKEGRTARTCYIGLKYRVVAVT
jgi:hypothetical protein